MATLTLNIPNAAAQRIAAAVRDLAPNLALDAFNDKELVSAYLVSHLKFVTKRFEQQEHKGEFSFGDFNVGES